MILNIGKIIAGRYEIAELIGAGGMSHVYRAVDKKLHRNVTVKVLRDEYISDSNFVDRFDKEARAIASLNHANIVNVYDVGSERDIHYIVMEYIRGKTLKELIAEKAPFTNEAMLGVAEQIAAALIHAHENGIIHRDIKPQNILCMPNGVVKVADFGIARSHDSRGPDEFSTMGSVHYISPEVACSDPVDPRSDLYSLGIVMFEMMTGDLPFDSDNADEITMLHVEAPFPNIRKKNPNVLPVVREMIVRLTNKQPFRRYQSANSLHNDIQRAVMESAAEDYQSENQVRIRTKIPPQRQSQRDIAPMPPPVRYNRGDMALRNHAATSKKRKEHAIIIGGVVTAAILILLLALLVSFLLGARQNYDRVIVPAILGQELERARSEVEDLGLSLEVYAEEAHETIPAGYITQSTFDEGDLLEPGDVILVVISLGPADGGLIEVPDIVGRHLADVSNDFDNIQLYLLSDGTQHHDSLPHNHIIYQDPPAGHYVDPGTQIRIVLSLGADIVMVSMPDLMGRMEHAARIAIVQAGLRIGDVTSVPHPVYSTGTVIGQSISEGTEVLVGSYVDFTVSSGILPSAGGDPTPTPPAPTPTPTPPAPTPTPTPTPDPTPTPTPTPDPTPTPPPGPTEQTLEINPVAHMPAGEAVHLQLMRRQPDGSLVTERSWSATAADLPIHVTVQGTGVVEFVLLINHLEVGRESITFNE